MAHAFADSGAFYFLTLRSERPVEGCELAPNAFVQLKGGTIDNSTRAKLLESNPYQYVFSWSRGPRSRICACTECPRGDSFEPVQWSKALIGGPNLLCNVCLCAGKAALDASFCSARFVCFTYCYV